MTVSNKVNNVVFDVLDDWYQMNNGGFGRKSVAANERVQLVVQIKSESLLQGNFATWRPVFPVTYAISVQAQILGYSKTNLVGWCR